MEVKPIQTQASTAPAVTIIIPSFNYSQYIASAIHSAQRQTFSAIEILIVDDGSTDSTAPVVKEFLRSDARIRYIYQTNAGLSAARNTGINNTLSQLVVFLDADDELESNFVARSVQTLAKLPPDFGLVACRDRPIAADGTLLPQPIRKSRPSREISRDDLILKSRFGVFLMARRQLLIELGGFDVSLRSSEDRDMWIRLARRARIYLLDEFLARRRTHGANMSKNSDRMRKAMRTVILRAYQAERRPWTRFPFWLSVAAYFHLQNAWMLYDEGRQREALRDVIISLMLWPGFLRPSKLDEPVLFRVRSLARFLFRPNRRSFAVA